MQFRVVQLLLLFHIFAVSKAANTTNTTNSNAINNDIQTILSGGALVLQKVNGILASQVKYYLFTSANGSYTQLNIDNPSQLAKTNATIVFIIHGWAEDRTTAWYEPLKNAFLQKSSNVYVVEVDWSLYALQAYGIAAYAAGPVGGFIGDFIVKLNKNYSIPLDNILIVGLSLGAQIAGYASKEIKASINATLPRIIALDAAGPLYEGRPASERLTAADAKVVEGIHTFGGVFGYLEAYATYDLFPNGGSLQPGCLPVDVWCNHLRSAYLLIEGLLNPGKFVGTKCSSYITYTLTKSLCSGGTVDLGNLQGAGSGSFYLTTTGQSPFF